MVKTHPLCRNNPFIPYRARPGQGHCVLEYPENLVTAREIILSIASEIMGRQCISCHRFITSPPRPELGHGDAPSGPECSLPHHPSPCPWVGPRGQPCPYISPPAVQQTPPVSAPPISVSSSASVTSTVTTTETPSGDNLLLQELQQLRREKEEEARRVEMLELVNSNLRDSQARLSQQLQQQSQP